MLATSGEYTIVCQANQRCFDADTRHITEHPDDKHKRIYLHDNVDLSVESHWWYVEVLEGGETVILKTNFLQTEPYALDGNCARYIQQMGKKSLTGLIFRGNNLTPYLWHAVKHAPNHQWKLVPSSDESQKDVFCIVNVENGKCLDGDMSEEKIWTPRLVTFDPSTSTSTSGLLWKFTKCIEQNGSAIATPAHYQIMNRANSTFLKLNTMLSNSVALYESLNAFDENWILRYVGDNLYTLDILILGKIKQLSVDYEESTDQSTAHPTLKDVSSSSENKWKLCPIVGEKNMFHVMHVDTGLFLLGKSGTNKIPLLSQEVDHVYGIFLFNRITQCE